MINVTIDGKSYPIAFTLATMDAIEAETGRPIGELELNIKTAEARKQILKVLAVMIREGAPEDVETPDAEALKSVMRPGALMTAIGKISEAITEGMEMETDEPDDGAEVDVVLESLKKKEPQGG